MKRRQGKIPSLYESLVVLALILIGVVVLDDWRTCTEAGGVYVRSLVWFACVTP